jgi:hypothetical protein
VQWKNLSLGPKYLDIRRGSSRFILCIQRKGQILVVIKDRKKKILTGFEKSSSGMCTEKRCDHSELCIKW